MRSVYVAIALGLIVIAASASADAKPPTSRVDRARASFAQGNEHSRNERWPEAVAAFRASLALKRRPMTLYSLGVALRENNEPLAALEHFRAFLAEPVSNRQSRFRGAAQEAVDELVSLVGRVVVRAEPSNALVYVGKRRCAAVGEPCLVDKGRHTITVQAPNFETWSQSRVVGAGQTLELDIVLEPAGLSVVPIALIGVGGASLIGGVVLAAVGLGETSPDAATARTAELATGVALMLVGAGGISSGWTWLAVGTSDATVLLQPQVGVGSVGLKVRF